jgi:hypothetical protein
MGELKAISPPWATVYTQIDADPVCRSNPPLAPPKRGTGVVFYSILFSKIIMLFQVPPPKRGTEIFNRIVLAPNLKFLMMVGKQSGIISQEIFICRAKATTP